jgi:hypothetical protein
MSNTRSASLTAGDEALAVCVRTAGLQLHTSELISSEFITNQARFLSFTIWVTGFDGPLSHETFPFPFASEPDGPTEPMPDGIRKSHVDILVIRRGLAWSECVCQIRSALHVPADPDDPCQSWTFRLDRSIPDARPELVVWKSATEAALNAL